METRFPIGTLLRSYDFESNRTCYAEGVLVRYETDASGCERYVIRVSRIVWEDKPEVEGHMIGQEIYPPVNGTPTSMGRVTNQVEACPAVLNLARLSYGSSQYPVERNETTPLPEAFDFENAEECARLICAVMSNASGGHTIRDCKVRVDPIRRTANITGNGIHVFYRPEVPHPLTKENFEAEIARIDALPRLELGSVVTDQYGEGWKRARWIPA